MITQNKISHKRNHDGALILSAIIQDGKACGAFIRERIYYGHTIKEARQLFRQEMKSNGAIFDDVRYH